MVLPITLSLPTRVEVELGCDNMSRYNRVESCGFLKVDHSTTQWQCFHFSGEGVTQGGDRPNCFSAGLLF